MRILRGLGSRAFSCGCLVGVYETYNNQTIALIDAKGSQCTNGDHRVDSGVEFEMATSDDRLQPPSTMPTMIR